MVCAATTRPSAVKARTNLQMSFASQECTRNEVVTGAQLRGSKNCGVQKHGRQRKAPSTRQRANVGKFGNADKGSAKADSVGNDGDEKREPQGKRGSSRQGSEENVVTVAPQCLRQSEKLGRHSAKPLEKQLRASRENGRYCEASGQRGQKTERNRETNIDRNFANDAVRKARQ